MEIAGRTDGLELMGSIPKVRGSGRDGTSMTSTIKYVPLRRPAGLVARRLPEPPRLR